MVSWPVAHAKPIHGHLGLGLLATMNASTSIPWYRRPPLSPVVLAAAFVVGCPASGDGDGGTTTGSTTNTTGPGRTTGAVTTEGPASTGSPGTTVAADSTDGSTTGSTGAETGVGTETGSSSTGEQGSGTSGGIEFEVQQLYDREYIHYAQVDKLNTVLNLYIEAIYIDFVIEGQPLPLGTILLREEGDPVVETVFIRQKVAADTWDWANFGPDAPNYQTEPSFDFCSCHNPWDDDTVTIASLRRFAATGEFETILCDQPDNMPCNPEVYE